MTIYKSILIQPTDKLLVRVWDTKEPHRLESRFDTELHYQAALDNWLKSYKEYEVHPAYVAEFMKLFDKYYRYEDDINYIEKGIEIDPSLIDVVCKNCGTNRFNKLYYCCSDEQYRLVKLKGKPVESEDDLWENVKNLFYIENDLNISKWSEEKRLILEYHNWLKQKYILKIK